MTNEEIFLLYQTIYTLSDINKTKFPSNLLIMTQICLILLTMTQIYSLTTPYNAKSQAKHIAAVTTSASRDTDAHVDEFVLPP